MTQPSDAGGSSAVEPGPEPELHPDPEPLHQAQVWVEDDPGSPVTRIGLSGEIDLAASVDLDLAVEGAIGRGRPVVLDVSRVTFMDSVGVRFIAQLIIAGRPAGWQPTVVGATQAVVETLTVSGVLDQIDLVPAER